MSVVKPHPADQPHNDPRLSERGVMRAVWPSQCRACPDPIVERAIQALAEVQGGRAWVHVECRDRLEGREP